MQQPLRFLKALLALVITLALAGNAAASVWMDENFDGTAQFVQGDGGPTADPTHTLDPISTNPLTSTISAVLTQTGSVVSTKAFSGSNSYRLNTGQTLAVGEPYSDQQHGSFHVFQFAVNVDPIPAAGTVGTFRWNLDTDNDNAPTVDNSFYVRLVSTGSAVNVIAGEDVAGSTSTQIGTLASSGAWGFVTVVIQKDPTSPAAYGNLPAGTYAQGAHFFFNSTTAATVIPIGGTPSVPQFRGRNWAFTVDSGSVYLDDVTWEGGMDGDAGNSRLQPFNTAPVSSVNDWNMF